MAALSQVRLPTAFRKSALEGGVAESDFLFLGSLGIITHEAFAMRVHSSDALEGFLRDHVCPSAAYHDSDQGLLVFNRTPAVAWREFQLSEDCAALRKLWVLSKEMSKAEVEKMASGEWSGRAKLRMGSHVAMEEVAIEKGMPNPILGHGKAGAVHVEPPGQEFPGPWGELRTPVVGELPHDGRRRPPRTGRSHAETERRADHRKGLKGGNHREGQR